MNTGKPGGYFVLAAGERLPEFSLLAAVTAEANGLNRDDAARAARHSWGCVAEGLDEAAAIRTLELCAARGLQAFKIPADAMPAPLDPVHIKKAAFAGAGLAYTGADGRTGTAAEENVSLLAAAPVKENLSRTIKTTEGPSGAERAVRFGIMAVTALPIGLGKSKEVRREIKSSELSFRAEIIFRAPSLRLSISSGDFDFSCLGEKKTFSSQTNFRLLCAELAAFAPRAVKNAGLLAILEAKPLSALPYDSGDDLEKELVRLRALAGRAP